MVLSIISFLICTTLQFNQHALATEPIPVHDPWLSQDKFLHFSVSAAITGYSYYGAVGKLDMHRGTAKTVSVSLTALIGIGKELYDKKKKGLFSWKDLFWDGAGITVGYMLFCR